jgi:hypothetical protein
MTNPLVLRALPDAPVSCDMSTARDTPDERLREYGELFERALAGRERRPDSVEFRFRADPGVRETVDDLARREAACCPFLDYRVETAGDEVVWTITNVVAGDERAGIDVALDAVHALPDHAGSDFAGFRDRMAERGVHLVEVGDDRFELGAASSPSPPWSA